MSEKHQKPKKLLSLLVLSVLSYSIVAASTESGFTRIKADRSCYAITPFGGFKATFKNTGGYPIYLKTSEITVMDGSSPRAPTWKCENMQSSAEVVNPGKYFELSASGCGGGSLGDPYSAYIVIPYYVVIRGIQSDYADGGILTGSLEGLPEMEQRCEGSKVLRNIGYPLLALFLVVLLFSVARYMKREGVEGSI
ncbi:MAG: hypothetical protein GF416_00525 [Candidatus Altiarchaeales archaeon]|nr:hypothetical protein [Candidatus Altiarchaeales archaeon]MBD3415603.1 hypothetical protein [Candidatus Altiarchaeales archaeon]